MKGLRIFQRFGFNVPSTEGINSGIKILSTSVDWEYDINRFDWYNNKGDKLTEFLPNGALINILENSIQ